MTLLALAIAPGLAICFYIFHKDIYNREPKLTLLISFILGTLTIIPPFFLETSVGKIFDNSIGSITIYSYLVVALSEELSKFIVLRYYCYNRKSFDEPLDGIVYAVMVGMGFATIENIGYVTELGYSIAFLRMFLAVPAHASFAILMGYYVGKAKFNPAQSARYMLIGLALAIFFHGTFDVFIFLMGNPNIKPYLSDGLLFIGAIASFIIAIRLSKKHIRLHQQLSQKLFKPGTMALRIHNASVNDINTIRELTFKVWPQSYASILTKEQIDYMLDLMYSEAALLHQMQQEKHSFIIIYDGELPVAFASYSEIESITWKLHKIYILSTQQGKGTGKFIIDHIIHDILPKGAKNLRLNVNRHNPAKGFYEKLGFHITSEDNIDIGRGYF
ncbi:MAG: GNAT family N-acetyltransferase, partial [Bacteroidota bacterium]|nr:GNAT family N-acetyltransferase [Bacteroidota bacterium]